MNLKWPVIISEHDGEVSHPARYISNNFLLKGKQEFKGKQLTSLRSQTQYNLENSNSHHL